MSQTVNKNSKIILIVLSIAIVSLSYVIFFYPSNDPIELPEETRNNFIQDDEHSRLWQENRDDLIGNGDPVDLEGLETIPIELSLLGTVASDVEEQASATIQSRLQIRTYFVNDQIAYTTATLAEVRNDRVILIHEGQRQVLLLQGTKSSNNNSQNTTQNNTNQDPNSAEELAQRIGNRPKLLEHIVATQPYTTSNGIQGLLVSPGQNPKLFKSARFKEGDVLQTVNGEDVNSQEGLQAIQSLLPTAQTLIFEVLRGGKLVKLYLDIPSEGLKIKTS